jgi:electron transfer flavoprotein beta subunit
MAAKSKPVDQLSIADLGFEPSEVGAAGARQQVTSVVDAESRQAGEVVVDEGDAHERVLAFLEQIKVI